MGDVIRFPDPIETAADRFLELLGGGGSPGKIGLTFFREHMEMPDGDLERVLQRAADRLGVDRRTGRHMTVPQLAQPGAAEPRRAPLMES